MRDAQESRVLGDVYKRQIVRRPSVDRLNPLRIVEEVENAVKADAGPVKGGEVEFVSHSHILRKATWNEDCLLYTSDAADERSSVDICGRRIINKRQLDAQ